MANNAYTRSYNELSTITDYYERFDYLRINGSVGEPTFGYDRYVNQQFYTSTEWRQTRLLIVSRDLGRDMGHSDFPINGPVYVHHMSPLRMSSFTGDSPEILDPDNLISVSLKTHNAIHFGDKSLLPSPPVVRRPYDTVPWR